MLICTCPVCGKEQLELIEGKVEWHASPDDPYLFQDTCTGSGQIPHWGDISVEEQATVGTALPDYDPLDFMDLSGNGRTLEEIEMDAMEDDRVHEVMGDILHRAFGVSKK